ncbi:UdgX family uracil-DNA binding protein [Streptomyces spirodelae]|uniref:Type-4 uracil-DNA glycosylase n=1 Tax=Streptomyces spirodelae TaxID=2812904 RepID=A0ABS3WZL7_9ACTN|nr:UdgX family uracil-DNA binding protein [Streptomyces spirodelae]MBO8188286.1 UdgX family uracil-DNA binding protein [Streptomyces spirodelae]
MAAKPAKGATDGERPEDAYDATPFLPESGRRGSGNAGLRALREAAAGCRGCPLHENATQTVFGTGDAHARVFLVGEQPGDQEDRKGAPFVGPAGRMLDRALDEAGIDPAQTYVTNAVKHFKWAHEEGRGKRRIHKPPTLREMTACGPWLAAELVLTEPEVLVVLGATAGKALFGSSFRVTKERGSCTEREVHGRTELVVPTIHPSAILRADDQDEVYGGFLADLRVAARMLEPSGRA